MNDQSKPTFVEMTDRQRETWARGDFSVIAFSLMPVSDQLVMSADPPARARVLDVACGSGNTALVAARRYCEVTGIDFVPALLARAEQRSAAEGTAVRWSTADAQALPFDDGSFDFVFSTFGVMFAPDQQRAADELLRVCRSGGVIALASWTPEGGVGDFFRTVVKYAPPPQGAPSPLRWGTEAGITELLGARAASRTSERRTVTEYFTSLEHAVDTFRRYFGPTHRAFSLLEKAGQDELARDLAALFSARNRAKDGTVALPFEYLETLVTVR